MKKAWNKRRDKLLNTPINKLGLRINKPPLTNCIRNLYGELETKGISFRPPCYLSNGWGCPDLVPIIGIPFYLASPELSRLHAELGYDVENKRIITRTLRHEAGHAVNYAYRLYDRPEWRRIFGPINKAYDDHYIPNPFSKQHVMHVKHYYAQKHPDEDFAEAFAVWLTPGGAWKRLYAGTPVMEKLLYVGKISAEIAKMKPVIKSSEKDIPVEEMQFTLLEYYGVTPEQHKRETAAYLEEVLSEIFTTPAPGVKTIPAAQFIRRYREELVARISFWAGVDRIKVKQIFNTFAVAAERLGLRAPLKGQQSMLIDLTSLLTFYVYNYIYTKKVFRH
jgi:hypothetical protein